MSDPILVPITDLAALRDAGIRYPETVDGWRWAFRVREERGLTRAFVRQGRRVLVDVPAYLHAVRGHAV
ncbi:MAG TPA: hypothetical protein VK676_14580 [Steroidobacteraceae bacterium]|jgi:hypothetical protein|nr:hypothetical protein [Steroidobacteraceae bacterium]